MICKDVLDFLSRLLYQLGPLLALSSGLNHAKSSADSGRWARTLFAKRSKLCSTCLLPRPHFGSLQGECILNVSLEFSPIMAIEFDMRLTCRNAISVTSPYARVWLSVCKQTFITTFIYFAIDMGFEIKEIATKPYEGQKPGTSGLRKRLRSIYPSLKMRADNQLSE
jgi:hypothetical protein